MADPAARPFSVAFGIWFSASADLHDIVACEACADRDAVMIHFLIGDGALQGYAHSQGISVSALRDGECWDLLMDEDLVAENEADGWFCALCPADGRQHLPSIETLWADHLFEAFRRWVSTLGEAQGVGFYGGGGITWAKLITDPKVDGEAVHAVMFSRSIPSSES